MNKVSNFLWGLVLIAVGVIFGLNALEITDINIFFDGWWTLFIIVPSFIGLFKEEAKTGNLIGLIIGICLFLGCQDYISFDLIWKLMMPTILVIIGLSIIFKDTLSSQVKKEIKKLNKNGSKEYAATFGGQTVDFSKEEFEGCSLTAVFGSIKCDLREAIIKEDTVINASSIFGGVSDERKNKTKDNEHTIYLNATSIFGGVEIK